MQATESKKLPGNLALFQAAATKSQFPATMFALLVFSRAGEDTLEIATQLGLTVTELGQSIDQAIAMLAQDHDFYRDFHYHRHRLPHARFH